jgi:multidrug efflux pump subunit AcrA (membrane-fusion protein)
MKWTFRLALALLATAVLAWLLGRAWRPEVVVSVANRGAAVDTVAGTAEVFANADLLVRAERGGTIEELTPKMGEFIARGARIARLSSTESEVHLAQAQIRLEAARERQQLRNLVAYDIDSLVEQVENTRLAVQLQQTPAARLSQEERELEKRRNQLALERISQDENLRLIEQEVRRLEYIVGLMTVHAPFAGQVVEIRAFAGDIVGNNAALVRLVSAGRFVEVTLSEEDFHGVAKDQPVSLRLASYPDRVFRGHVQSLALVANRENKTRKVFVEIPDTPDELLVPGLTGEALILKAERADALLVPRRALIGDRLYVVAAGRVEIRPVQVGFVGLHEVEIIAGISAGDQVVVEGQDRLQPGERVRVRRL